MGGIKKVVIVGGGFAGVKTALELANKPGIRVRLISDNSHFEHHHALYQSTMKNLPLEVMVPLKEIFHEAKNVEVIIDKIGFVDAKKRRIASQSGEIYDYDFLVLALGNTNNYYRIPGAAQNTYGPQTVVGAMKLRNQLAKLVDTDRRLPLRIVIIGGSTTGVRLAGDLPRFVSFLSKRYRRRDTSPHISLIENTSAILPDLDARLSKKALVRLKRLGVKIYLKSYVTECQEDAVVLNSGAIPADLIIWAAGSKTVDFYKRNSGVFLLKANGKVAVNNFLQVDKYPEIHVLGNNAATPYSGSAQTALHDAKFVSQNILRDLKNRSLNYYRPRRPHNIVPIGSGWAIAQIGSANWTGRRGWLLRHRNEAWITKNFEPYKQIVRTWQQINKRSKL